MGYHKVFYTGTLLLSLLSARLNAQLYIGIEGGGTRNYLNTNISNLVSTQYNPAYGFNLGVPVFYQINDWLGVQADLGYFKKNYQMERTDFFQGVYQNTTNAYAQLPVMAHLSFGGSQLKGFVNLGGYGGYWITGKVQGREPNILNEPSYTNATGNAQPNSVFDEFTPYTYNEKYQFNNSKDNRIEWGGLAGIGVSYETEGKANLFVEGRYYQSMSDQQKNYQEGQVPRYNEAFALDIGCMIQLMSPRDKNVPFR